MISLIVFIACLTTAHAACSCKPFETVKEAFCQSDYVLLARVLSINSKDSESPTNAANDTNTTASGTWNYRIWHVQTWKGPVVATSVLTTPNGECGVTGLLQDWDYFLTGKKGKNGEVTFTSCDFVMPWTDLTPGEHDLLLELMWDPKKCEEKDDEKKVEENDEKKVEGNDEKKDEENDEENVEENDDKNVEENNGENVEENNGE
ncbi:tissue inhibitor of metalloproteinase, partial [Ancylostoma caninum]